MAEKQFLWECHPKAEELICRIIDLCCQKNPAIQELKEELFVKTSTRLLDWVDHLIIGNSGELEKELKETGFTQEHAAEAYRVFHHPGAQLPSIVIRDQEYLGFGIAIKADSIADFLMVRGISASIEGSPFSRYRRALIATENQISLYIVERRGTLSMEPVVESEGYLDKFFTAINIWQTRSRFLESDEETMKYTLSLVKDLVALLGVDLAAWVVLECERRYWQSRNRAGQVQKNRQDHLGLGWANHDHHTFRSSRKFFSQLVRLFEMLGFYCRERFYAGEEAGWGAQVMENPRCHLTLFLDVDLDPHELQIDFAHQQLNELKSLGTIGLWCGLHGDSILKAGMHHLEAQFMFQELTNDLKEHQIGMMQPFSDFDYLKQAFTVGETWPVEKSRIDHLIKRGLLTSQEGERFFLHGAIGSHLENLQRRDGYKGFNQKNVSYIIKETDPRAVDEKLFQE